MIQNKSLTKLVIVFAAIVLLALLYFFADARYSQIFPKCIFYSFTGLYCPGCGSQRAFSALLHGDWEQALSYNLLFILCLPLLFYSALVTILNASRKKQVSQHIFYSPLFVKVLIAVIIVFWIARNVPVYPFNLLAPHTIN